MGADRSGPGSPAPGQRAQGSHPVSLQGSECCWWSALGTVSHFLGCRIEGCPLDIIVHKHCNTDQRHTTNIPKALTRPLYGECEANTQTLHAHTQTQTHTQTHTHTHTHTHTAGTNRIILALCGLVIIGLWGFPFGRAPEANVFQCTFERLEDNPIINDPTNPPGKDLLVGEQVQFQHRVPCQRCSAALPPPHLQSWATAPSCTSTPAASHPAASALRR